MTTLYNVTTLATIALEKYELPIQEQILKKFVVLQLILMGNKVKKKRIKYENGKYISYIQTGYPMNFRGTEEAERIPTSSARADLKFTHNMAKIMGTSRIPWEQTKKSEGNDSAHAAAMVTRVEQDMVKGFQHVVNAHTWGIVRYTDDGGGAFTREPADRGTLGIVRSVAGATPGAGFCTITLDLQGSGVAASDWWGAMGNKYFKRGMPLGIGTPAQHLAGSLPVGQFCTVAYTVGKNQIVVSPDISAALGALPAPYNGKNLLACIGEYYTADSAGKSSYGKVPLGIVHHASAQTLDLAGSAITYQGVDRSVNTEALANEDMGAGAMRDISVDIIQGIHLDTWDYCDSEEMVDVITLHPDMLTPWQTLFATQIRYDINQKLADPSLDAMTILGKMPVKDPYHPRGTVYGIALKSFCVNHLGGMFEFHRSSNGKILDMIGSAADFDLYEARARMYYNLANFNPRQLWVVGMLNQRGQ